MCELRGGKSREDNQSCIKIIQSSKCTHKSNNIDIKYHWIRNLKETGHKRSTVMPYQADDSRCSDQTLAQTCLSKTQNWLTVIYSFLFRDQWGILAYVISWTCKLRRDIFTLYIIVVNLYTAELTILLFFLLCACKSNFPTL